MKARFCGFATNWIWVLHERRVLHVKVSIDLIVVTQGGAGVTKMKRHVGLLSPDASGIPALDGSQMPPCALRTLVRA